MKYFSRPARNNAALALAIIVCLAAPAAARSLVTNDTAGSVDYLNALAELTSSANRVSAESLHEDGPLLRIAPDGALAASGLLTEEDRELAQTARRLFVLYQSIGGRAGSRALLFQRTKAGLFVAREGATGAISASLRAAMGGAVAALARSDTSLPEAARAWLPQLSAAIANPGGAPPQNPIARIARNQPAVITLTGPEIARAGADAILAGPRGSRITLMQSAGGQLQARIILSQDTPDGFSKLYLYRGGDALNAVADFDISVGTGRSGASQAAAADDHGATARTATALLPAGASRASLAGQIGAADDVDMFRLNVTAPGSLVITSRGSSDVTARLLDSRGNPVASNDDGGAGYNFGMQAPVNPGNYLLSVQHCCGGGGNYQIDTALTPQ